MKLQKVKRDGENIPWLESNENTLCEVLKQYTSGLNPIGQMSSGSFNEVQKYGSGKVPTIIVRQSKKPMYTLKNNYILPILKKRTESAHYYEQLTSYNNWKNASNHGVCPEVIFYGYIRKVQKLYLCIVQEAFDMDLLTFWDDHVNDESYDSIICKELLRLTYTLNVKLSIACSDVKPENTVVRLHANTPKIRIIDLDGDMCVSSDGTITSWILTIIMYSMHFTVRFKNNIFYEFLHDSFRNGRISLPNEGEVMFPNATSIQRLWTNSPHYAQQASVYFPTYKSFASIFQKCLKHK